MVNLNSKLLKTLHNRRIAIIGNYGDGNIGDEAMLSMILDSFRFQNYFVVTRKPNLLKKLHKNIKTTHFLNIFKLFSVNLFFFGGGTVFSKYSGKLIYLLLDYIRLLNFFGLKKNLVFYRIGISKSCTELLIKKIKDVEKNIKYISVRDTQSKKIFEKLFPNIKTIKEKDILFDFDTKQIKRPEARRILNAYTSSKKLVGVSLNYTNVPKEKDLLLKFVIPAIRTIIQEGNTVLFFTFCPGFVTKKRSDKKLGQIIKDNLGKESRNFIVLPYLNYKKLLSTFSLLQYSIAMRFHAKVFSILTNVPFFPIYYEDKCVELCNEYKVKGHFIEDLKNITFENEIKKYL